MFTQSDIAAFVFFIALPATFFAAFLARCNASGEGAEELAGRHLNRWLVGLSAATTGNSGFIVTGAVGLGYAEGVHALLLPFSWLLGDLIFWALFPALLNKKAREYRAVTVPTLIAHSFSGPWARAIIFLSAMIIVILLSGYVSAQWIAAKKMAAGISPLPDTGNMIFFALLVISYTCVGGFRGSVYTDLVQAVIRIVGTLVAVFAAVWMAMHMPDFSANIAAAGGNYLSPFSGGLLTNLAFIAGFACAAIGFGLGQPQIVARYMAGRNPDETHAARWIYIGFAHGTWLAMTLFGILLRGIMPDLADPEAGLSIFFMRHMGAVATGIIAADIFATIASTSNGILVTITQTLRHDLLPALTKSFLPRAEIVAIIVGCATIMLSLILSGTVASLILSAVSLLGAGLGGVVMIRIMNWQADARSIFWAILASIAAAVLWKMAHLNSVINEAAVGFIVTLTVNHLLIRYQSTRTIVRLARRSWRTR